MLCEIGYTRRGTEDQNDQKDNLQGHVDADSELAYQKRETVGIEKVPNGIQVSGGAENDDSHTRDQREPLGERTSRIDKVYPEAFHREWTAV